MKIGLLEDDIAIQEMLTLVFQGEGYAITIYPTAKGCLDALLQPEQEQGLSIDLLIVDWRLAGSVPGTEVIRILRDNPLFAALPIILTTAATIHDTEELQDLHVALLQKPFAVDEIVNLTKRLVQPGTLADG
jgi:two-component system, chemotaxis family, chemotaxis protein CheY